MTMGQLVFYSGVGLLGLTAILGIVFLIWRPKYRPENEAVRRSGDGSTQQLINGYPGGRQTVRRDTGQPVQPMAAQKKPSPPPEGQGRG